jgi:pyruvate-ferredoxin/flavodoxin oxidoreductase
MKYGADQQKLAVDAGVWPLYRFDPRRIAEGQPPLHLDSDAAKVPVERYMRNETRFRMVEKLDPKRFKLLIELAQQDATERIAVYQQLAGIKRPIPERVQNPAVTTTATES